MADRFIDFLIRGMACAHSALRAWWKHFTEPPPPADQDGTYTLQW